MTPKGLKRHKTKPSNLGQIRFGHESPAETEWCILTESETKR